MFSKLGTAYAQLPSSAGRMSCKLNFNRQPSVCSAASIFSSTISSGYYQHLPTSHFSSLVHSSSLTLPLISISSRSLHSNMLPINKLVDQSPKQSPTKMSTTLTTNGRTLSTDSQSETSKKMFRNFEEFEKIGIDFEVPVPWGHISCREFGQPGGKPVLMTHGWLDNLCSWSQLVPELLRRDPDLHIITFDEPGCGHSSAKPKGMYYESLGTMVDMRRIVRHMQTRHSEWKNLTLIGHSKGAYYSFLYAAIYPDTITQLISCDMIGPEIEMNREIGEHIDQRITMDLSFVNDPTGKRYTKIYTYEKAVARFMESRPVFGMTRPVAELLLKRGMRPVSDGYIFTRDIQWNFFSISLFPTRPVILDLLKALKCDIQLLISTESPFKVPSDFWDDYKEVYKRCCRVYDDVLIPGKHYIHMDEAELLADKICAFMKKSQEIRMLESHKSHL